MEGIQATGKSSLKILSVVWFKVLPPKFGGQKAVAFFNKYLAEHASLICLCSKDNQRVESSYVIRNELPNGKMQVLNPFAWWKIYKTAKKEGVTHLLIEFPYHGIAGILCKNLLGVKLIVNTHNIEYRRFKEQKKWWWRLLFYLEKIALRSADAVFFKTADDLKTAQEKFDLKEKAMAIIPYGVEEKAISLKEEASDFVGQKHAIKKNEKILLFAGTLDYSPNADALVSIVEKLIPLLNQQAFSYKIVVCGRNRSARFRYLDKLQNDRLIIAGEVDDIEAYFEAADLFINPVLHGGGIQTKTMEALSYHLNVVCFASKAAGICHAGNKIFAVPDSDWNKFSCAVMEALETDEQTPPSFFETYNWRSISAQAYHKIISC